MGDFFESTAELLGADGQGAITAALFRGNTLVGGAGNDTYALGDGYATIERLTLLGSDNINATGNGLNNQIAGNAGNNTLDGGSGSDSLTGGAGNDTYILGAENDAVTDSSGAADRIFTTITRSLESYATIEVLTLQGSGDIDGTGNGLANTLNGNTGDNTLNGRAGADIISGGTGDDLIIGGTGIDNLTGRAGADTFVFDAALSASTNIDTITDFLVADDTIRLEDAIFTALTGLGTLVATAFVKNTSGQAQDANDRIIYETDTGKLFYDANGSGVEGRTQFALLTINLALTNSDFIVA